jgi:hypothetical protein
MAEYCTLRFAPLVGQEVGGWPLTVSSRKTVDARVFCPARAVSSRYATSVLGDEAGSETALAAMTDVDEAANLGEMAPVVDPGVVLGSAWTSVDLHKGVLKEGRETGRVGIR